VNGDGGSRIEALFRAGDQRFWHVDCPGCGAAIVLEFKQLQFERKPPHKAFYAAQCCGHVIEHFEKATLVRCGRFIATNPDGLYPSFHVDALISQITTWDKIAEEWVGAQGKERKEKSFYNLWLGLPYEVRGDAPDYQRLMERREDYPENIIPPLGLILVVGADVQHNGIWVEIVVYAPDKQSWCISKRFLEGDTTDPTSGAFADLAKVYEENFQDSWGQPRKIDGMAVDAGDGGRANQVYLFCRGRHKAHAVKGMPGWGRAPIGTPTQVGIRVKGNVVRGRTMLWPVGTWDLKAEFYADLRKDGKRDGQEQDPPGYCHFGKHLRRGLLPADHGGVPRREADARPHDQGVAGHRAEPSLRRPGLCDGDRRQARPEPHDARTVAEARADEEAADGEGRSLRAGAGSGAAGRRRKAGERRGKGAER
jgi:phage terminase large subunit GpA-like protein